jgi:fumarylacetoacetate (FAA) hydrolase
MRLATLRDGSPDGRLVVVSPDGKRFAAAPVPTLQAALEDWARWAPGLAAVRTFPEVLDPSRLAAPLPRAWQWLDGSAYESHGALMAKVFNRKDEPREQPLMYQGLSDRFYGPNDEVPFTDEALGIDFEGEFGIITDAVPMGTSAEQAFAHIRLIVQVNDWSLRTLAPIEMKTGFGWIQAKPACSMAPFAVTPEELGDRWRNGRVALDLHVDWNGRPFGRPNGEPMGFGFHQLVAHAARTRDLVAGTVIGSGTVSNENYREIGSSCIAERRGIELLDIGNAVTQYMRFGDRVRMEARDAQGRAPFGVIDQRVAKRG